MNKHLLIALYTTGLTLLMAFVAYVTPLPKMALGLESVLLWKSAANAQDRLTHPPERQTFTNPTALNQPTPSGTYQLTISTDDSWQTPTATGELRKGDEPQWQQSLPHQYGPRFALVAPTGQAVLFDEYINVASEYAIALINPTGEITHTYSFDDIQAVLQQHDPALTRADIVQQATTGWWISEAPMLGEMGTYASVKTGNTTLYVDLESGALMASDIPCPPNPAAVLREDIKAKLSDSRLLPLQQNSPTF